jgi:hypothetical protein
MTAIPSTVRCRSGWLAGETCFVRRRPLPLTEGIRDRATAITMDHCASARAQRLTGARPANCAKASVRVLLPPRLEAAEHVEAAPPAPERPTLSRVLSQSRP